MPLYIQFPVLWQCCAYCAVVSREDVLFFFYKHAWKDSKHFIKTSSSFTPTNVETQCYTVTSDSPTFQHDSSHTYVMWTRYDTHHRINNNFKIIFPAVLKILLINSIFSNNGIKNWRNPLLDFLKTSLADWKRSCPFDQRREKKKKREKKKLWWNYSPNTGSNPAGRGGADHLIKQHGGNERSKGLHFLQERRKNGRGQTRGM